MKNWEDIPKKYVNSIMKIPLKKIKQRSVLEISTGICLKKTKKNEKYGKQYRKNIFKE